MARRAAPPNGGDRGGVLGQIRNPLVFFALALLVIEGIIGLVVTYSKLTGDQQFYCIWIMAGLFVLVVASVFLLTVFWPRNIMGEFEKVATDVEELKKFIDSTAFKDVVIDILEEKVKPDSLAEQTTQAKLPPHPAAEQPQRGAHPEETQ